jgi:hypothetical protein
MAYKLRRFPKLSPAELEARIAKKSGPQLTPDQQAALERRTRRDNEYIEREGKGGPKDDKTKPLPRLGGSFAEGAADLGAKVGRFKGALQSAADRKMQEIADYGFKKGQELEEAGYPGLGAAAANAGAGAAAVGSTLAGEGLDYIPESVEDVALAALGPAGKLAKKGGRIFKIADKAGETVAKNNSTWTKVKTKAEEAADIASGKNKVSGLGGETSNAAMAQLREELHKQGKNEMEIDNTLRRINNAVQYGSK